MFQRFNFDYWEYDLFKNNIRICIKVHKHFNFDCRRYWRLASVWMDETPIMVIQNAGREGDDYSDRFITNVDKYKEMILELNSLLLDKLKIEPNDLYDINYEDEKLTNFYGNKYDGYFSNNY